MSDFTWGVLFGWVVGLVTGALLVLAWGWFTDEEN